ncbi:MAG: 2-dehydropantoate 2-reductase [Microcella sp.]|uniref:ketopantoate reductase family protein n=1 Tax=Microcella sp. TaxID=1913979 RepID=UPI003315E05D
MRIAVIGAGAVGGTLAALLQRAGHDVVVTARGEHGAAIEHDGLLLTGGWGVHRARVRVVESLAAPLDLLVLATKVHDTAAALGAAARLDGTPVIVVQNGLGGEAAVRDALPHSPVAIGLALFAASLLEPGQIEVTGPNPLVVGGDPTAVAAALPALRSALPAQVTVADDIVGAQWTKLLVNQVNALPAITGWSVQQVVAHDGLRAMLTRGMRETATVARAAGVRIAPLGAVGPDEVALLLNDDAAAGEAVPRALAEGMGDVPNPASTLQSIRRGRATEIDALNGVVVAAGSAHGVATPVNALMVELVHEVERTGAFLDPTAALARLVASTTQD